MLFGREDKGLLNDELKGCDMLVTIPTDEVNPIMNLSHACTVVFYELFSSGRARRPKRLAGSKEKEVVNKLFAELLDAAKYPQHKKAKTKVMFRKIVARAGLSTTEFHTLAGVFSRASKAIKWKKP